MLNNRKLLFFSVIFFLFCAVVHAQQNDSAKVISRIKVNAELREKLRERFNSYVQYLVEKDYEKQFELIYPKLIGAPDCKKYYLLSTCYVDKNEFIRRQKENEKHLGKIQKVTLKDSTKKLNKDRNLLNFETLLESSDGIVVGPHFLYVFLDDGQWYFSTFYTIDY